MISETIDEGSQLMQGKSSPRTIGKGDDAYTETLKQFTGIPAEVSKAMQEVIKSRKGADGKKVKVGDVYGEALNGYMKAVESGQVVPDIKAQSRGEKAANVGVWIRTETTDRFEKFVTDLGIGGESEVLTAALRWFIARH